MKYAVFAIAALGVPPLAFLLYLNRRWMRYVVWGMVAALCLYQGTAINFFSFEEYRGSSRGMEVSVIYLFAAALLLVAALRRSLPRFVPSAGAGIYLLYFLLCLPSWGAAEDTLFCWMETWKMALMYVTYLAVLAYLEMSDDLKSVLRAFAFFAVWNFLLVVKAHVSGVYQPHGVFPHQNSMVMAMHLLGSVFFAFYMAKGWRGGKIETLAFVAAAAAAVRSYSRGALALMPLSYAIVGVLLWWKGTPRGSTLRLVNRFLPIALAGAVGLAAMLPRIIERFKTAPESSKTTRVELANCALEMIKDEPWRGVGINNWGIKINPPYEYAERAGRFRNNSAETSDGIVETVYLLVGAECGVPALVCMLLWFFSYLILALRLVWRLAGTWYACLAAGLVGGLTASYLQSCLEWVLRQQINLIFLVFFFAILDYLNAHSARLAREAAEQSRLPLRKK